MFSSFIQDVFYILRCSKCWNVKRKSVQSPLKQKCFCVCICHCLHYSLVWMASLLVCRHGSLCFYSLWSRKWGMQKNQPPSSLLLWPFKSTGSNSNTHPERRSSSSPPFPPAHQSGAPLGRQPHSLWSSLHLCEHFLLPSAKHDGRRAPDHHHRSPFCRVKLGRGGGTAAIGWWLPWGLNSCWRGIKNQLMQKPLTVSLLHLTETQTWLWSRRQNTAKNWEIKGLYITSVDFYLIDRPGIHAILPCLQHKCTMGDKNNTKKHIFDGSWTEPFEADAIYCLSQTAGIWHHILMCNISVKADKYLSSQDS